MLVTGKLSPRHNRLKSLQRCVCWRRDTTTHLRRTTRHRMASQMPPAEQRNGTRTAPPTAQSAMASRDWRTFMEDDHNAPESQCSGCTWHQRVPTWMRLRPGPPAWPAARSGRVCHRALHQPDARSRATLRGRGTARLRRHRDPPTHHRAFVAEHGQDLSREAQVQGWRQGQRQKPRRRTTQRRATRLQHQCRISVLPHQAAALEQRLHATNQVSAAD